MIRLGYVGVNTNLPTASKTFRLSNYTEKRMLEIVGENLKALLSILRWNLEHNIYLFRITSQLIPFGSHPINSGNWRYEFKNDFAKIGKFIKDHSMRVSMHPGQYTVLNSPNDLFYQNALDDLEYHNHVLELMELDASHRIVIHGGGVYGDKQSALVRLRKRICTLPTPIYKRLMLENDDLNFNAQDILSLCHAVNTPAVLDVFHHQLLPSFVELNLKELINLFKETWNSSERQKIHYSTQEKGRPRGAHAISIDIKEFANFYDLVKDMDFDIMLEVKDKEQSLLHLRKIFLKIY